MSQAKAGDVVKCLITEYDVVAGKCYTVRKMGGLTSVWVIDDSNEDYLLVEGEYETVEPLRSTTIQDINGNGIYEGDFVAYAYASAFSRSQAVFEIVEVNGVSALCRAVKDGATVRLGVFEERALKLENYARS